MSHRSHVQNWRVGIRWTGPGILCWVEGEAMKMFLSQGNKFISKCPSQFILWNCIPGWGRKGQLILLFHLLLYFWFYPVVLLWSPSFVFFGDWTEIFPTASNIMFLNNFDKVFLSYFSFHGSDVLFLWFGVLFLHFFNVLDVSSNDDEIFRQIKRILIAIKSHCFFHMCSSSRLTLTFLRNVQRSIVSQRQFPRTSNRLELRTVTQQSDQVSIAPLIVAMESRSSA